MKKIIALALTLVLCTSMAAFAEPVFEDMDVTVELDGTVLEFDQKPLVESGRTLVPVRKIFETLGAMVHYDDSTRSVISIKDDLIIFMQIDHNIMYVNEQEITLDVPAREVGGRTLVPLRAISDAMGVEIIWDEATSTAKLFSK